ncbi:uncharacterized protein PHA67_006959 isoform 2-T2 [Liasis olivaceus]
MGLGRRQQQQQQQQQQQPGDISARASTATCSPTETERKEERKRLGTPVGSFAAALQPGSPDPVCLRRAFLRQLLDFHSLHEKHFQWTPFTLEEHF